MGSHTRRELALDYCVKLDPEAPLDRWISYAVKVLREGGIETFEACEGGSGHSYPEPSVRFHGAPADGFRALSVAVTFGLPVRALNRTWRLEDGEPVGPSWTLTFWPRPLRRLQREAERTRLIS